MESSSKTVSSEAFLKFLTEQFQDAGKDLEAQNIPNSSAALVKVCGREDLFAIDNKDIQEMKKSSTWSAQIKETKGKKSVVGVLIGRPSFKPIEVGLSEFKIGNSSDQKPSLLNTAINEKQMAELVLVCSKQKGLDLIPKFEKYAISKGKIGVIAELGGADRGALFARAYAKHGYKLVKNAQAYDRESKTWVTYHGTLESEKFEEFAHAKKTIAAKQTSSDRKEGKEPKTLVKKGQYCVLAYKFFSPKEKRQSSEKVGGAAPARKASSGNKVASGKAEVGRRVSAEKAASAGKSASGGKGGSGKGSPVVEKVVSGSRSKVTSPPAKKKTQLGKHTTEEAKKLMDVVRQRNERKQKLQKALKTARLARCYCGSKEAPVKIINGKRVQTKSCGAPDCFQKGLGIGFGLGRNARRIQAAMGKKAPRKHNTI